MHPNTLGMEGGIAPSAEKLWKWLILKQLWGPASLPGKLVTGMMCSCCVLLLLKMWQKDHFKIIMAS